AWALPTNRSTQMQERSCNRPAIGLANNRDLGGGAITNETNGGLWASLDFSQVFKLVRTKYVHNLHRRRYVMMSFTLDPLHSEISWVRGLFSELPRFFGDRSDLFAPQRQSSCTLTRSREPTL